MTSHLNRSGTQKRLGSQCALIGLIVLGLVTATDETRGQPTTQTTTQQVNTGAAVTPAPNIDPSKPGDYRSGRWEYHVRYAKIQLPKTQTWSPEAKDWLWRSAELALDGKPLPHPHVSDCIMTPWGMMQWTGAAGEPGTNPQVAGWFLLPFKLLPNPDGAPGTTRQVVPRSREQIDLSREGTYRAGRWEFRSHVSREQYKTRGGATIDSERHWGELLYDGKPIPQLQILDCVQTPWGMLQWKGDRPLASDSPRLGPGWVPIHCHLLPDPAAPATQP